MIAQTNRSLQLLRQRLRHLRDAAAEDARRVLDLEEELRNRFRPLRDQRIQGVRIRHHGDFHLGQVLYTGKDFMIIDFEGEPGRPMSERRLKRSPLRDVSGMIRSFQYAAYAALFGRIAGVTQRPEMLPVLAEWAAQWNAWTTAVYLKGYFATAGKAVFLPAAPEDLRTLLDIYTLEKALYEVAYELNNRPDWVRVPLNGILKLMNVERR
jgi:maltose alpha-D-glucosyltransferase/alpha-amylase